MLQLIILYDNEIASQLLFDVLTDSDIILLNNHLTDCINNQINLQIHFNKLNNPISSIIIKYDTKLTYSYMIYNNCIYNNDICIDIAVDNCNSITLESLQLIFKTCNFNSTIEHINKEDTSLQLILNTHKSINLIDIDTLWSILDILKDELLLNASNKCFYNNRGYIIEGFKNNKLFMLNYDETPEIRNDLRNVQKYRLKNTFDSLPCFCLLDNKNEIDIIWTALPYRKLGFAKCFIEHFYVNKDKHISCIIPEALTFWEHMGFKYDRLLD